MIINGDINYFLLRLVNIESVKRVNDLAIYKLLYILIKKLNVLIGKEDNEYICRR